MELNISKLFALMQSTLRNNNIVRPTALKNLQIQEDGDPFKILIGTILSARTRDEVTTAVIKALFSRFKNPDELSRANLSDIKKLIQKIGFYNVKASRLKEVSQLIIKKYNGEVPSNVNDLLTLPGVGRKTANCVLVYGFKKAAIPVDIHVHRISNRIGIVNTKNPEETENVLQKSIDKKYWIGVNETFVTFGQNICLPIKPKCNVCQLTKMCKYYSKNS
ncbi:MAG: endonuclease III [Nitrososphaeraceae archaeon]|jgi:endonuclease III|nr:endonuclease III [Nitrososphaeraceae archaeon]MDW0168694.1 endonuclease III [Nitrososphaeraceae archaeon]MDW0172230.1 endonuclease III [Nitrososphaeraceae archaeon]MDW0172700.1 endonuclease III [Nitrososphaeraceae archaeon]MDW0174750.1 endonuclease III [Nitrososphaeraceae archaeon]